MFCHRKIAVLSIFIFLTYFPSNVVSNVFRRLQLPSPLMGPVSLAFDLNGRGPYTGVSDGRILKYQPTTDRFTDFAYTGPNRTKARCDGTSDPGLQATCGRPLGLSFYYRTGELFVADAHNGLMVVGPNGGPAKQLVTAADCVPFNFLSGLDVDQTTGTIYFTEASSNFRLRDWQALVASRDSSGSLFQYDPTSKQVRVLLRNLSVPAGVAVSRDGSFVLVTELLANRIIRFWLTGPRANRADIFRLLRGRPHNIRRNSRGQFWVAVNTLLGPPPPPKPPILPLGVRISEQGLILSVVSFARAYGTEAISEVQEFNMSLYAGSQHVSYGGILSLRP